MPKTKWVDTKYFNPESFVNKNPMTHPSEVPCQIKRREIKLQPANSFFKSRRPVRDGKTGATT